MKRVKWLQDFFGELQRDKTLRSSEVFQAFISMTDDAKFTAIKKKIQKIPTIKDLTDLRLLEGSFNCELTAHKIKLSFNVNDYTKNMQKLYKEINTSINNTTNIMLTLSDSLSKNADLFKDIAAIHASVEVYYKVIFRM